MKIAEQSNEDLYQAAKKAVNRAKTSKFEAFIVMITVKNMSRDKVKALVGAPG